MYDGLDFSEVEVVVAATFVADIHIAGDYQHIVNLCQEYCTDQESKCVHVVPEAFAYRMGQEFGAKVGIVNYPRFPQSTDELSLFADRLARWLMKRLCQGSCLIVTPGVTTWLTRRGDS